MDRIGRSGGNKAGLCAGRSRACMANVSGEEGGEDIGGRGGRELVDLGGASVRRSKVRIRGLRVGGG